MNRLGAIIADKQRLGDAPWAEAAGPDLGPVGEPIGLGGLVNEGIARELLFAQERKRILSTRIPRADVPAGAE